VHHDDLNRLRWRCTRRATLELDLLLGQFLDARVPQLDETEVTAFTVLADMEDHDLWALINGAEVCEDPQQARVVTMLQESRKMRKPA
jgi:antitoxin CptB